MDGGANAGSAPGMSTNLALPGRIGSPVVPVSPHPHRLAI
jgi:hypothetical protein